MRRVFSFCKKLISKVLVGTPVPEGRAQKGKFGLFERLGL